jgi:branched-chain amino acid transport system permease protein
MLIYGIAVVLIIMFRPNGLYGYKEFSLKRLIAKLKGKGKTEIGKEAA